MLNKKADDVDMEPIRRVVREAQVVRLHQPEMEMPIGIARRVKNRAVVRRAPNRVDWKADSSRPGARSREVLEQARGAAST